MFCEGWDTKRSPLGANSIIRALGKLSAYNSTVKPAGAFGIAPSGFGTTLPKLGRASVGAGNNGRFCWASITRETHRIPRQSSFVVRLLFISLSTFSFRVRAHGSVLRRNTQVWLSKAVERACILPQDHSGQFERTVARDFAVARHLGKSDGKRFAPAFRSDPSGFFPA